MESTSSKQQTPPSPEPRQWLSKVGWFTKSTPTFILSERMRRDMSSDNSDSVPESVGKIIDSEQVIADIDLGGGNAIFVTPAQTIRY